MKGLTSLGRLLMLSGLHACGFGGDVIAEGVRYARWHCHAPRRCEEKVVVHYPYPLPTMFCCPVCWGRTDTGERILAEALGVALVG